MNFHARCLCGPPRQRRTINDARDSVMGVSDPTGTLPLQRRFGKDLDARWIRLRKMMPDAVTRVVNPVSMIAHAHLTGDDPVRAFQAWIDEAMRQLILGATGSWTLGYVRQAGDAAHARSTKLTRVVMPPAPDRVPLLQTLCVTELQGVCEAVSQQAVRSFTNGLLTKQSPSAIARAISQVIDQVGRKRSRLLVSFIVVRAFGAVTLDSFRALGYSLVGTVAERVGPTPPGLTRDAKMKKKSKKSSSSYADPDLVEVLTAGDDLVCPQCEEISEGGPYTLDEAELLIPAHPRCRCAFVPWGDARFASVRDENRELTRDDFNPDQPRDKDGKWTSGDETHESFTEQLHAAGIPHTSHWQIKSFANQSGEHTVVVPDTHEVKAEAIASKYGNKITKVAVAGSTHFNIKTGTTKVPPVATQLSHESSETSIEKLTKAMEQAGISHSFGEESNYVEVSEKHDDAFKSLVAQHGLKALWTNPDDLYGEGNWYPDKNDPVSLYHLSDPSDDDSGYGDKLEEDLKQSAPSTTVSSIESGEASSLVKIAKSKGVDVMHYTPEETGQENHTFVVKPEHSEQFKEMLQTGGYSYHKLTPSSNEHVFKVPLGEKSVTSTELDISKLTKVDEKKGSNEGGVYENLDPNVPMGPKYYIKSPQTKDHVQNELLAAKLYQLAGAHTLTYVPVKGGEHVATVMETLGKSNVKDLTSVERLEAQHDFAVHAWLANWDAAGTGGDNIGITGGPSLLQGGKVTTLDVGGSLKYRAKGGEKGVAFGNEVSEINSLRDPQKNPDAAALFGPMTNDQIKESIKRVVSIPNGEIVDVVHANMPLAPFSEREKMSDRLIARKNDLASQLKKMETAPAAPNNVAPAPQSSPIHDLMKHVKGTSAERVAFRKQLQTITDPESQKQLKMRVLASFLKQHDKETGVKKADVAAKLAQYSQKYKMPNPLLSVPTKPSVPVAGVQTTVGKTTVAPPKPTYELPDNYANFSQSEKDGYADIVQLYKEKDEAGDKYAYQSATSLVHAAQSRIKNVVGHSGLTPIEAAHIVAYSGAQYRATNAALRAGTMTETLYRHVNALDSALDKLPGYDGKPVWRRANMKADIAAKYVPGNVVTEWGFTSTAKKQGVWSGDYRFHIETKKSGSGGKDIEKLSSHGDSEAEVLFKSGSRFLITKRVGNEIHMREV